MTGTSSYLPSGPDTLTSNSRNQGHHAHEKDSTTGTPSGGPLCGHDVVVLCKGISGQTYPIQRKCHGSERPSVHCLRIRTLPTRQDLQDATQRWQREPCKLAPYFRVCRPSAESGVSEPWRTGAKNSLLNSDITGGALVHARSAETSAQTARELLGWHCKGAATPLNVQAHLFCKKFAHAAMTSSNLRRRPSPGWSSIRRRLLMWSAALPQERPPRRKSGLATIPRAWTTGLARGTCGCATGSATVVSIWNPGRMGLCPAKTTPGRPILMKTRNNGNRTKNRKAYFTNHHCRSA